MMMIYGSAHAWFCPCMVLLHCHVLEVERTIKDAKNAEIVFAPKSIANSPIYFKERWKCSLTVHYQPAAFWRFSSQVQVKDTKMPKSFICRNSTTYGPNLALLQVQNTMFQFRGRVNLLCLTLQIFLFVIVTLQKLVVVTRTFLLQAKECSINAIT